MKKIISVILTAALSLAVLFPMYASAAESKSHTIKGNFDSGTVTLSEYLGVKEETFTLDNQKITANVYSVVVGSKIKIVSKVKAVNKNEYLSFLIFPAKLSGKQYKMEPGTMISGKGTKSFTAEKQFNLYSIMLPGDTIYVKVEAGEKPEAKGKPVTIEEKGYGKITLSDVISQKEETISLAMFDGGKQRCTVYYVSEDSTVKFSNKNESLFIPYKKSGSKYTQDKEWKQLTIFKGNKTFTLEAKYDLYLAATLKPNSDTMLPAVIKVVKEKS